MSHTLNIWPSVPSGATIKSLPSAVTSHFFQNQWFKFFFYLYAMTLIWKSQDNAIILALLDQSHSRYPGTVPLQIRWTAVDVVEPWRACCDRPTRYERNHRRTGLIQNDLTRKQNYNSKTVDDLTIALEILPKISIAWVGRTNVTDDRQTDDRRTDDDIYANVNHVRKNVEFSFPPILIKPFPFPFPWN